MSDKYVLMVFENAPSVGDRLEVIQSNPATGDGKLCSYLTLESVTPCEWEYFWSKTVNVFPWWTASCRPGVRFDKAPSAGGWKYCPFCGRMIEVTK